MFKKVMSRLSQPSTYAGIAAICTAISQTGFVSAIPIICAGVAAVLVDA